MSEYRQDPLSRRWVIIGCDERAGRPNEFVEAATRQSDLPCPFCLGNEAETPAALATYSASGNGEWTVRVVPNKYPAVTTDAPPGANGALLSPTTISGKAAGFGCHEVIIESPRHVASLSELTADEAKLVFTAYRDRLRQLKAQGGFQYAQIFKNVGPAAGASLEHVHSQLVALPGIPEVLQTELASCEEHFEQTGRLLLVELIEQELLAGERIVAEGPNFIAFCPYASRFPYELCVAPRQHQPRFEDTETEQLGELSQLVQCCIQKMERALGQTPYNYLLHTQPFDIPRYDHYHWHIEILPRLTKVAGFEWGTGCFINPYAPEAAAAHLRKS